MNQSEILDPINHLLPVKLPALTASNSGSERIKVVSVQDDEKNKTADDTLIDL